MAVKYESCGDYYLVVDDETDREPIAICGQSDLKCIYKYCEVFKKNNKNFIVDLAIFLGHFTI